ncbi:MerR family transcriptional regulator [Streptomyces indicus]|uniref:DNA-binding transcriptional regulator, MerR family n=1 Tax=Streptomyces indicus TaxID=417292 RepID=A0A1G8THY3_9ACTN|nr:MerR family transcriptional regulator [Streptomyces indicus]SDJ41128.1 DNA-binding transcriptional regulator, MerR family [Streptomyces indicus]
MKSTPDHDEAYGIGELAAHYGLATHVLRHWESVGLLHPHRDTAGRRVYGHADRLRIGAILCAKDAGLSLAEIHTLTSAPAGPARRTLLRERRAALTAEIARLQAQLALVECGLNCPHEDLLTCTTFQAIVSDRAANGARPAPGRDGPVA